MKRSAAALALLVMLAGCSIGGTASPGNGPADGGQSGAASTKPPAGEPSGDPTDAPDSGTSKIGDKYTYDDGLVVEIIKTKRSKVSQYAAGGHPGDPMAIFTVRITNGTKSALKGDLVTVQTTYGKDGNEAEAVYDQNLNDISGTIPKGRAKTGTYGFAVPTKSMSNVVVEIGPDFDHESAVFSGSVK